MDYQLDEQDLLALLLEEEGIVFAEASTIPRRVATEPTLLSFAQQRLWILQQMEPQNPAYNIPLALRLCGQLDQHALGESFNEILRRHEVLRTHFVALDGRATADILPTLRLPLPVDDLRHLPPAK